MRAMSANLSSFDGFLFGQWLRAQIKDVLTVAAGSAALALPTAVFGLAAAPLTLAIAGYAYFLLACNLGDERMATPISLLGAAVAGGMGALTGLSGGAGLILMASVGAGGVLTTKILEYTEA